MRVIPKREMKWESQTYPWPQTSIGTLSQCLCVGTPPHGAFLPYHRPLWAQALPTGLDCVTTLWQRERLELPVLICCWPAVWFLLHNHCDKMQIHSVFLLFPLRPMNFLCLFLKLMTPARPPCENTEDKWLVCKVMPAAHWQFPPEITYDMHCFGFGPVRDCCLMLFAQSDNLKEDKRLSQDRVSTGPLCDKYVLASQGIPSYFTFFVCIWKRMGMIWKPSALGAPMRLW